MADDEAKAARAEALGAVLGAPVDLDRFHGDDDGVGRQVDLLADSVLMGQLEELRASAALDPLGADVDEREALRRLLLMTAVLRVPVERQPRRVVEPDAVEARLLRLVADFRTKGAAWPSELQLVALRSDAWLRRLGAARERWRSAAGLLGLDLADALDDDDRRRWWWPSEVPERPIGERPGHEPPARPVVYLPDHDGPRDVLGLGATWKPGQALVVGAGFVRAAWPHQRPQEPTTAPQEPLEELEGWVWPADVGEPPPAAPVQVDPRYVAVGLEHLDDFLAGGS